MFNSPSLEVTRVKDSCFVKLPNNTKRYILQRAEVFEKVWYTWTLVGFESSASFAPDLVENGYFVDEHLGKGVYQYRVKEEGEQDDKWEYSFTIRSKDGTPFGYTFGNYKAGEGEWGEVVTADDVHYTYLWGVAFKASDGTPFQDSQTRFFINAATREVARRLNITIKKTRICFSPEKRGLVKGKDYDEEESFYPFNVAKISRQGFIATRKKPIVDVTKLDLFSANNSVTHLLDSTILDKTKGLIKFFKAPYRMSDTQKGIWQSLSPYGASFAFSNLFYGIDYIAGYECSDDVPDDLREIIAKQSAVSLLNIIGDGLISGFSSSSLSMDGLSESFSSTQSATSAYFGARIKVYEEEIESFIKENKRKFGHLIMGVV